MEVLGFVALLWPMSIKKLLYITTILITFLLLLFFIDSKIWESPLKKDTEVKKGYIFESELQVLISGKYSLFVTFDSSIAELQKVFGEFGCWNRHKKAPCGTYKDYEIHWTFTSNKGVEVKGKSTPHIQQGGSLGQRWKEGIGLPVLTSGVYTLKVRFNSDFSQLSHLNPQIELSPGGMGAKTYASSLQANISIFYVATTLVCYFLLSIILLLIIYRRTKGKLIRS
ncbi:hypothetical protein [Veronia pacifica]|uniref:Uncharacterized protein n=1 Tax=Veronia pacifica TaxID=1080227 RepID=A0A1C3ESY4_9GAMM|nr:hypothetical protein A8L45_01295 [Veronia pacifica]